jgi:hypothetical protein
MLLCAGCGATLSAVKSSAGWDRASSHPEEEAAALSCSGKPCAEVPLRRYYSRRSGVAPFVVGSAVDLSLVATGAYAVSRTGNAASGALLAAGALFMLLDGAILWSSHGLPEETGPWTLPEPVTASFRGRGIAIEIGDVTSGGTVRPTFSVAALARPPICSAASPIPRDVKSLALFDAVSLTRGLRPESVRYLTEVVRVRLWELFPSLHVVAQSDFAPLSGEHALSDGCDVTCRLGIAQKLETAASATADLTREGDEFVYQVTVRSVTTGEVITAGRARGKDLLQLDFAVRDVTGRMLGCRE